MKLAKTFNTVIEEEFTKFNPYHDKQGRFCSGDGAFFTTIRTKDPKKQYLADSFANKQKQAIEDYERERFPKLAGVSKGRPMTFEEADNGKTNPGYFFGGAYRTNCQTCVVAMEARRRGYNVSAKEKKEAHQDMLAMDSTLAWRDPKTGSYPKLIKDEYVTTPKRTVKWLDENVYQGQRYTFEYSNKGRRNSGHIISLERTDDGELMLHDPQSGDSFVGNDEIEHYCRLHIKYKKTYSGIKYNSSPKILRVDNLDLNYDMVSDIFMSNEPHTVKVT